MSTKFQRVRLQALAYRAAVDNLKAGESGSVAIETAVAYLLMMSCVFGILGFTLMLYTYCVYQEAARTGVRYATVHGTDSSSCSGPSTGCGDTSAANVVAAVNNYALPYAAPISGMNVLVSYPDTGGCKPPSRVIVTVTYSYTRLFQILPSSLAFQVSSQGRIIY